MNRTILRKDFMMMRPIKKIVFSVIIFLTAATSASAAGNTYYVATTGSDTTNLCSQTSPCLTINKGISKLSAGDMLIIHSGTYAESISTVPGIPSGVSPSQPTVIKGAPNEQVIIKPSGGNNAGDVISIYDRSYITIDNVTIDASNVPAVAVRTGGNTPGNPFTHYVTVQNSTIKNAYHNSCFYTQRPISVASNPNDHINYINNDIYNCGWNPSDPTSAPSGYEHAVYITARDCLIDGNRIHHAGGYGIKNEQDSASDVNNNIYRNNSIHDNRQGGIILTVGTNNKVINNIFWNNGTYNVYHVPAILMNGATYTVVDNNTVVANPYGCIMNLTGSDNSVINNNVCWQNGGSGDTVQNSGGLYFSASNNLSVDPKFVNASANDYHLQSGSAAIDKGMDATSAGVTTDLEGKSRPQGAAFDIGAYEYGGTTPPPSSGVSVDSTYSGYTTTPIDDGVINASGGTTSTWASADNTLDHWIQVNFNSPQQINTASIFWAFNTSQNKYMTAQRVDVQSWNGSAWVTLGSMTYSGDVASSSINFPAVTTSQLRFLQPANLGNPSYTTVFWVTEVEYGNRVVSVDSTYSGYSTNPIDDEVINASGGTATTWASSDNTLDHWIQIDFGSQKIQLNSATISWAFNPLQNKYMTSQRVDVQSWNGTAWVTLASTTYSGDVASSTVTFAPVTTSKIRFFQPANLGNPGYTTVFWITEVNYCNSPSVLSPPSISPNGGTFSAPVSVTLSAASGASIYYTTNGSTPSTSSTLYSAPITVSSTSTIKAIAVKSGMTNSPVASATFTISIPPTLNLTAAPILTWMTTNATTCTASGGWTGAEPVNGTASLGSVSTTASYVLTCTGPGGTIQRTLDMNLH